MKVILSNNNSLCRYLQRKTVDVISARRNADMTIQTLRQCWSEESFSSVWQIASAMGLKIKKRLTNSQFELRGARAPRQTPSLTLTMRPSTRCCPSLSLGLAEMTRKYSVLWEIFVTVKRFIKKASPALLMLQNRRRNSGSRAEFRRVRV